MLDKTGTITLGNRQASAFVPAEGVTEQQTIGGFRTARLPGGRNAGRAQHRGARQAEIQPAQSRNASLDATLVPFRAQTRISGIDLDSGADRRVIRKGSGEAIRAHVTALGGTFPEDVTRAAEDIARRTCPWPPSRRAIRSRNPTTAVTNAKLGALSKHCG